MKDWQPDHYLKFSSERTQPSIDLVNRIKVERPPKRILDAGCGPGNSTHILYQRWPDAHIIGIDSSENMIRKAETDYPRRFWQVADISTYAPEQRFDIVYSNATIQWIPHHDILLKKLHGFLSERGILAVQVPQFIDMPLGIAIENASKKQKWNSFTAHCRDMFTYHNYGFYYDQLSELFTRMEMWVTSYLHEMDSHDAIIDWIRSTGMKPFLDVLPNSGDRDSFSNEILEAVKENYPARENGKVIFPFKRLFFGGYI